MSIVDVPGARLELLPERAVWWGDAATLFVADVHVGKDEALRAGGIGLPPGSTEADLDRLTRVARRTGARRLVILGDFLHARSSRSDAILRLLGRWRRALGRLGVVLVRGNHDRSAGDPPRELDFEMVDNGTVLGPFHLHHEPPLPRSEPPQPTAAYALAGHLHPAVRLRGDAADRMKLPAFIERSGAMGARCLVLPAFSTFTGGVVVRPERTDRVWVVGDGRVVALG